MIALWLALSGCIWSKHYHDYEIALESPGAVSVVAGGAPMLAPGPADASASVSAGPKTLTATRNRDGVRMTCEPECFASMVLVKNDGRLADWYRAGTVELTDTGVVAHSRFAIAHEVGWQSDPWIGWTYTSNELYVPVELSADWKDVRKVQVKQHPSRLAGWLMWAGVMAASYPATKAVLEEDYPVAGGLLVPMAIFGWWGAGQIVGGKREIELTAESR